MLCLNVPSDFQGVFISPKPTGIHWYPLAQDSVKLFKSFRLLTSRLAKPWHFLNHRKRILHSRAKTSLEKLGIRKGYEHLFMVIKVGIRKVVWKSFLLHCKWYAKGADWSHTPRIDSGMCIPVCDWLMNHGPFWFSSYRTKLGVHWEKNLWLHMQTLAWVGAL